MNRSSEVVTVEPWQALVPQLEFTLFQGTIMQQVAHSGEQLGAESSPFSIYWWHCQCTV